MKRRFLSLSLAAFAAFTVPIATAKEPPPVGTQTAYSCTGPYGKDISYRLTGAKNGLLNWEISRDGKKEWVRKPPAFSGTSLFTARDRNDGKGKRGQKVRGRIDGFETSAPGSVFNGRVDEWDSRDQWTWKYSIRVGDRKAVTHPLLGAIETVTIHEKRFVEGGSYRSDMEITLPVGQPWSSIGWTYKDDKGTMTCELVSVS